MKFLILCGALILGACSTQDRFNVIASSCNTYAVALQTAASLNRAGKLPANAVKAIDDSVPAAKAVCSGPAPSTDSASVQKISDAIVAVLKAQETAQ